MIHRRGFVAEVDMKYNCFIVDIGVWKESQAKQPPSVSVCDLLFIFCKILTFKQLSGYQLASSNQITCDVCLNRTLNFE